MEKYFPFNQNSIEVENSNFNSTYVNQIASIFFTQFIELVVSMFLENTWFKMLYKLPI